MRASITTDVLVIGAGAAGLMCAQVAGSRGRSVTLIEHSEHIGEKIRISGGGRCNFTNIHTSPDKYISANPHFCKSALKQYTPSDFIKMVETHDIAYHEKTLGQLFCNDTAQDIIRMLIDLCRKTNVQIHTRTTVDALSKNVDGTFMARTTIGDITATSVVIATGGLSIPKIGASAFGYEIAKQFGLNIISTRAGLVPLIFDPIILDQTKDLSGVSIDPIEITSEGRKIFHEAMLFTHRGISGPAVLQISSYWNIGEHITINLCPDLNIPNWIKDQRRAHPKLMLSTILSTILPKRLVDKVVVELAPLPDRLADFSDKIIDKVSTRLQKWIIKPSGSEGYRTAEVTLGGVDTTQISSKTFEATTIPGLYFIGEVLDVTGHLGGYNFQWAWSSGWCAGQAV